jgi:hypothetical protein
MKPNSTLYRSLIVCLLISISFKITGQGRLILNGGIVSIAQEAYLVIDNPAANAITRNSGHIISEGEKNSIKWNIGTTTGTYTIPWGYGSSDYVPLTFIKTAGTGSGHFLFSTYRTAWNNSALLPTGVTNMNCVCGFDNSTFETDRFWQINAVNYTAKPALTNVEFTYLDTENASLNTILESGLRVKRYNSVSNTWTDNYLSNSINTTTNKVTVPSIDVANLQAWWTLGTLNGNRYWVAPTNSNSTLAANWSASSGGAGNAGVPILGDAIFFDGAANSNCVLDSDLTAFNLTVSPAFAGTITQGTNIITVNNDVTFSGGTFLGGAADIIVNGNFLVSGTSFTAPSLSLNVKGNFSVTSGTFNHNNGTVVFSGANGTAQTITSATATTFNNITATNTSATPGISVQSNQNLKGVLTLGSNVNFDADGTGNTAIFKLLSTNDSPTSDAAIAALPAGAQVSGKVTVQRFMTKEGANTGRIYRYISSPILNATVADLQQEIPVTGTFTGRSSCSGCTSSSQSLFAYNETVLTDTDGNGVNNENDGYIDFPSNTNTETFQNARGYALYVRANLLTTTLWDLRGTINSGNVTPISFPITYTSSGALASDGWNLVGNPFPSTIDWEAASGWTKTNVESSIYITDNGSAASIRTASWNGVTGTNGGSRYISTGQGFWIKANGNGAPLLQANENIKAAGTQTTFFRQVQPTDLLRVTLVKGVLRDETVIHFREDATEDFDGHADARKLPNSLVNLSSILKDGKRVAINSLPSLNCNTAIPLSVTDVTAGSYSFDFTEYQSFPDGISIILSDNFLGKTHNIRNGSYSFAVTSALASYGAERFKLSFSSLALNPTFNVSTADVCDGEDIMLTIDSAQAGVKYDALSKGILLPALKDGEATTISIPKSNLQVGENRVIVRSSVEHCNSFVEQEVVFNVNPLITPSVESGTSCSAGSVTLTSGGAPENATYNWYEEFTAQTPIEGQHSATFETPSLKKSKTYFVSIVNALGCEGARIPVKATVVNLDQAVITVSSNILTSSHASGNQWYFNDTKIEGANGQTIQPVQSGTYKTEVTLSGCSTFAQFEFVASVETVVVPPPAGEDIIPVPEEEEEGEEEEQEEQPIVAPVETVSFYNIISISPNPFQQTALLEISDTFKNVTKVRIISSLGHVIGFVELTQVDGKKIGNIQLDDYPAGVYLLQIFSTTGVHQRKVIKQ